MALDRQGLVPAGQEHLVECAHGDREEVLVEDVREGLELGPQHPVVERGRRRRDDDGGAPLAGVAMGVEAVAAAERDEDRAPAGVRRSTTVKTSSRSRERASASWASETLDAGANGGGVSAPPESER